jgi:uncharacterized membrane protein YczE
VRTGLGIGWTTFGVSVGVLALWIPLRQRPGLGTVMNIIVIALAIGVTYPRVSTPDSLFGQLGLVFLGIGTALFALFVGQSVALGLAFVQRLSPESAGGIIGDEEQFPQGEA